MSSATPTLEASRPLGDDERIRRGARYSARSWQWRKSALERVRHCGRVSLGGDVGIRVTTMPDGRRVVGVDNVVHCGSVWACPVCSARIMARRGALVAEILRRWSRPVDVTPWWTTEVEPRVTPPELQLAKTGMDEVVDGSESPQWFQDALCLPEQHIGPSQGRRLNGRLVMVTMTARHKRSDGLKTVWDAIAKGWNAATSARPWADAQLQYGTLMDLGRGEKWRIPFVRVVEVTWGRNGWHVHVHGVLLVRDGVTDLDASSLGHIMWKRWDAAVQRAGLSGGDEARCDAHLVTPDGGGKMAEYFSKAVYEVTGARYKTGRQGNLSSFGILAALVNRDAGVEEELGVSYPRLRSAWKEFEEGSKGRRLLGLTHGLLPFLGLDPTTWMPDDQEIVEEQLDGPNVAYRTGEEWNRLCLSGAWRDVVERFEESDAAGLLALDYWLSILPPLERPEVVGPEPPPDLIAQEFRDGLRGDPQGIRDLFARCTGSAR